jgi:beta-phosphoglucomutase-like phosphatase (HAD superfamily)
MTGDTGQPTWDPSYKAAIFDVDAVTDAADLHAAAWRSLVETLLPSMGQVAPAPSFGRQDYRRHMHGHLSEDVIRTLADAYNIRLAEGDSKDPPGAMTIRGLATRKRELFAELVKAHGVVTSPPRGALLRRLGSEG